MRPNGASIHLTEADRKAYIKAYWDRMPERAPDEYSRPTSGSVKTTVYDPEKGEFEFRLTTGPMTVSDEVFERVRERIGEGRNGLRFWKDRAAWELLQDG